MKTRYKIWHKRFPIICELTVVLLRTQIFWDIDTLSLDEWCLMLWVIVASFIFKHIQSKKDTFWLLASEWQELLAQWHCITTQKTHIFTHRCRHSFCKFCSKVFIFTFPEIFLLVTEPDTPLHSHMLFKLLNSASCCLQVQFIPYILLSTHNARSNCNRQSFLRNFMSLMWA